MYSSTICVASGRPPARSGGEGDAVHRRASATPSGGLPDATRRAGQPRPTAASAGLPDGTASRCAGLLAGGRGWPAQVVLECILTL